MKNKNINIKPILIIIAIILLSIGLTYKMINKNKKDSNIINITLNDLETKINNKETFVLVITQTGCSHCEQYLPELNRTLKNYNIKALDLNITNLNKDENKKLSKYVNFSGTPTTIFFIDGEEQTTLNRLVGFASKDKIIERLKSLGYIK